MLIALILLRVLAGDAEYSPTEDYVVREIEGFTVRVHEQLLTDEPELADETLMLLGVQLYEIKRAVPEAALDELREIPIWVEYRGDPRHPCMCYHPSREWLTENAFNPAKAGSVEIANPRNFLSWTHEQPSMVLHELAHGYHHQVLGYDHDELHAAYLQAKDSGTYEEVLHVRGHTERAYAMNNDQEYFAELSEALFGTNDFYPFVRGEIKQQDPEAFELLKRLWGVE